MEKVVTIHSAGSPDKIGARGWDENPGVEVWLTSGGITTRVFLTCTQACQFAEDIRAEAAKLLTSA